MIYCNENIIYLIFYCIIMSILKELDTIVLLTKCVPKLIRPQNIKMF